MTWTYREADTLAAATVQASTANVVERLHCNPYAGGRMFLFMIVQRLDVIKKHTASSVQCSSWTSIIL